MSSLPQVEYEKVKAIADKKEAGHFIIDVRTKEELAKTGQIPNATNVPCMIDRIN